MELGLAAFSALAVALGVKHAFDADHLVAVSSLLTRRERVATALSLGGAWAAGHMVTATVVSGLLFFFADSVLAPVLGRMELLVPFMLLAIGVIAILVEARRLHVHRHSHPDGTGPSHTHLHAHRTARHEHGAMAGIGFVHGLASNDELLVVILVALGASVWWQVFLGVALFSAGVFAGMVAYAASVNAASTRLGWSWAAPALNVAFGLASVAYAVYLFAGGSTWNPFDALG